MPNERLHEVISTIPELSDRLVSGLAARRQRKGYDRRGRQGSRLGAGHGGWSIAVMQ